MMTLPSAHTDHAFRPWSSTFGVIAALVLACGLEGCALFPLAAVGGAALNASGGAITRGTEYTMGGTARRTFTSPIEDVHAAILETFERTAIRVAKDETSDDGRRLVGEAERRTVKIELTSLTPTLTSMKLLVKRNILLKDRATASELVTQTEHALADRSGVVKEVCCDEERAERQSARRTGSMHRPSRGASERRHTPPSPTHE